MAKSRRQQLEDFRLNRLNQGLSAPATTLGTIAEIVLPVAPARILGALSPAAIAQATTQTLTQEKPMGFFSSIAKIGGTILGGLGRAVGILPPLAAAAAPVVRRAAPIVAAAVGGGLLASQFTGGAAAGAPGTLSVTNPATGQIMSIGRGNGLTTTITQVVTIDNATGAIRSSKTFAGAPAIMQREVAAMKRAAKKAARIHGKIPRRVQKQGINSMITAAVKDQVLHSVQAGTQKAICPA